MTAVLAPRVLVTGERPEWDYDAQPKEQLETCNLCNGKQFAIVAHRDRYSYPTQTYYCLDCGLAFLNPRITLEAYAEFYRETYRDLISWISGGTSTPKTTGLGQDLYAHALVKLLKPYVPRAKRILDIGGSGGRVSKIVAEAYDARATVLDPGADERTPSDRLTFLDGTLESVSLDEQFDLILMCQTSDHLLDLKGGLVKARALLAPGGAFYVDILDFRMMARKVKKLAEIIKVDHPFYISDFVMEHALHTAGFHWSIKSYLADGRHVGWVCKHSPYPAIPHLPDLQKAKALLEELTVR